MARDELQGPELARLEEWESEHPVEQVHVTVSASAPMNRRFVLWTNITQPVVRSGSSGIEGAGFSFESALSELSSHYSIATRND